MCSAVKGDGGLSMVFLQLKLFVNGTIRIEKGIYSDSWFTSRRDMSLAVESDVKIISIPSFHKNISFLHH